jgi:hypothetical protein
VGVADALVPEAFTAECTMNGADFRRPRHPTTPKPSHRGASAPESGSDQSAGEVSETSAAPTTTDLPGRRSGRQEISAKPPRYGRRTSGIVIVPRSVW